MSAAQYFSLKPEQQLELLTKAAHASLPHWSLDGAQLELIKFRENAVFAVNASGKKVALRVHRLGYHSNPALQSELQWMRALSDSGIETPVVIPAQNGELFIEQALEGLSAKVQIDLFEWIEGEQLGSVEEGVTDTASVSASYYSIGELAAKVHNQSSSWELPEDFTRHAWDEVGLAGEQPLWGRFWEIEQASDAQRALLIKGRDHVLKALSALPKTRNDYGMIHADLVTENVMVDDGNVKLIDFDDAGFGWHLFEIATALYFIIDEPYYQSAHDALLEGYRKHRELTDAQLELLPLFYLARAFTYVGWVHTRPETETALELTPVLLEMACKQVNHYFKKSQ